MPKPGKTAVNVTDLRRNLPAYLAAARKGQEIAVTSRGKIIARIVAGGEQHEAARARVIALRKDCFVGDVTSPTGAKWESEQ